MKTTLYILAFLLILGIIFALGPRVPVDKTLHPSKIPSIPNKLDAFLQTSEAKFKDIRPGTNKMIVWANPSKKEQTDLSIVYLHGFSATRQETAPLTDQLAKKLGANLYYTRLRGHGRTGEALANASVNDWLNDTVEALKIGRVLGKKILIVATSTGATLANWLATQVDSKDVIAHIHISPNFTPKDSRSRLLLLPWGSLIARLVVGSHREWKPSNEKHRKYWTYRYPTRALLPLMGLVQLVEGLNLRDFHTPLLVLYSPKDQVINTEKIKENFPKVSAKYKKIIAISGETAPSHHVLAGDALSPQTTPVLLNHILNFLKPLNLHSSETPQASPSTPKPPQSK